MSTRPSLLGYAVSTLSLALAALSAPLVLSASLPACSSSSSRPQELADCTSSATSTCGAGGSGNSASGAGGGTSTCGDFKSSIAICQSCLDATCCAENGACSKNTACRALGTCLPYCTTQACVDECNRLYADGTTAYAALNTCASNGCAAACTAPATQGDAGVQCGTLTSSVAACQTCIDASCCSENQACSNDSSCPLVLSCEQACAVNDTACVNTCRAKSTTGTALLDAFTSCASARCPACN